jgi:16S rRNA processing protein RimM
MGKYIKVGTITSTHGIKGEVKVFGDNPCFSTSFKDALYIDEKLMIEVHIKTVKNQNGKLIVSFKEFNDINQVERYKNCGIYADRDTLEPLDEDEVYVNDLIGMDVFNEEEKFIGKVIDVREYPQCYYLVVKGETKHHLIPFIEEFVTEVSDIIVIHEMEGLL